MQAVNISRLGTQARYLKRRYVLFRAAYGTVGSANYGSGERNGNRHARRAALRKSPIDHRGCFKVCLGAGGCCPPICVECLQRYFGLGSTLAFTTKCGEIRIRASLRRASVIHFECGRVFTSLEIQRTVIDQGDLRPGLPLTRIGIVIYCTSSLYIYFAVYMYATLQSSGDRNHSGQHFIVIVLAKITRGIVTISLKLDVRR